MRKFWTKTRRQVVDAASMATSRSSPTDKAVEPFDCTLDPVELAPARWPSDRPGLPHRRTEADRRLRAVNTVVPGAWCRRTSQCFDLRLARRRRSESAHSISSRRHHLSNHQLWSSPSRRCYLFTSLATRSMAHTDRSFRSSKPCRVQWSRVPRIGLLPMGIIDPRIRLK